MTRQRMPISSEARSRMLLATTFLLAVCNTAMAASEEPGVTHALAIARAARVSHLRYRLSLTLRTQESAVVGTETLTFESKSAGDLPMDYRDGTVQSATLNGHAIPTELESGHLNLPLAAGPNSLTLAFTSNAAPAGKAITRYEDKDDGSEYFYTLFVPMDASMAFPCFDQPDLKAKFTLDLTHPATWSAISNTTSVTVNSNHNQFAETNPISTYLFAFAAGPFVAIKSQNAAVPTIYVRKSQLARAQQEAPQVRRLTARGIAYFSDYFAQPFPFSKYDLVLIPGFPFGGMEHAGATFLNEDSVLFRSTPTASDYFRRNILVLHETCHQWFGDFVTMRWFDDLWLKEGFAQYMAYKAEADLEPSSNPWKHFYEDIKPLAYAIDETQGTTPIFQNIANLKDAKSAYGAIVYQKAPAVLKQLEFRIGFQAFRAGLRSYLMQHAYGNAQWSDLISAFKAAEGSAGGGSPSSGSRPGEDIDVWADAWIKHRGMPQVDAAWSCSGGKIDHLTLTQHDVLPDDLSWPISNQISLNYFGQAGISSRLLRVDWNSPSLNVSQAFGQPCPTFLIMNSGDEAYGRFFLDHASEAAAARYIVEAPHEHDPLLRSMLWGALWDNVRFAKSPPVGYIERASKSLPGEDDESLARLQGARLATALHSYLHDATRKVVAPRVEPVVADRMLNSPSLGLRIVNFRTFASIAETPAAMKQVKEILLGRLTVAGLTLKPIDRWNLVSHLIAMSDPEAATLCAAEKTRDQSGEAQKYAYASEAATPSADSKARYFSEYLHSQTIQEDWITQSLRSFNSWNQTALTKPYLVQALSQLQDIKQHRKIFFLGAWLAAFVEGQNTLQSSSEAQVAMRAWLAKNNIDPDLRLKVLEVSDALDRTVLIRQTFPE